MKKNLPKSSGFSLVELLAVIAIFGFIAAIAVLGFFPAHSGAKDANSAASLENVQKMYEIATGTGVIDENLGYEHNLRILAHKKSGEISFWVHIPEEQIPALASKLGERIRGSTTNVTNP